MFCQRSKRPVCESYRSYGDGEGKMFELTKHKAYELLKTTWSRVSLDYVILSVGKDYEGYATHKLAVIEAFRILELRLVRFRVSTEY